MNLAVQNCNERKICIRHDKKKQPLTVKHGGDNIMAQGCFSADEVGNIHKVERTLNLREYARILDSNLTPSAKKLKFKNYISTGYNSKHTNKYVKEF